MTVLALSLPVEFEEPAWLWLMLLIPLLAAAAIRSLSGLDAPRRVLAVMARSVVIAVMACCLAGVQRVRRTDDLTVMFLMDRSYSVQALEGQQEDFIREAAKGMPPKDRLGLIDFARQAFLQQMPERGGYYIPAGRLPTMPGTDRTNVTAALRLAMAAFPHDTAKRLVLLSDGNDNMGDVLADARRARADGIPIDVVPLWYEHANEVYFDRLVAPTYAEPGEQISLRMILQSYKAVAGVVDIYANGELVEIPESQRRVRLAPGSNSFVVKLPVRSTVTQSYEAVFRPDEPALDAISLNNRARAFTFVSGGSRALLITSDPNQDRGLAEALRSEQVAVDMKTSEQLGEFDLPAMMSYGTIILSNVPAATFTEEQQKALAVYVKDMGSGLIMTGGDEGFGAGGWIGSPLEEVMPVSFEIKHKRVIPRGALVLIMHSCEIARGNYWAKEMAKKSVDTVSSQDYFGLLAYTYSPGGENWEVPLDVNTNKDAVKKKIDRIQVGDMPDFGATMQMAFTALTSGRGRDAAQKHVIILSDGDASAPSSQLVSDYIKAKITVSTIGIGWGNHVMETVLRDIAQKTGGRYYAAKNPKQLPQIFSKESKVVRRPLLVEEPFRPSVVLPGSELLAGLDPGEAPPPLNGMVLTTAKQNPNVLVPLIRSTSDGEDPVLAYWQYELGKTVAFTSGFWPAWGEAWTRWPKFAKFWAQLVRWTMRQDSLANFDTYTRVEGNRARIVIDALDKDATYLNNLMQKARVVGPDNRAVPANFTQTGPGKYEANLDVERAGQYLVNVQVYEGGRNLGTLRTGLTVPFSPEYRDLKPNEALLRQIAETTGGRWLDGGAARGDVFRHDLPPSEAKQPAWEWVLSWLVLPAFLLDVAVRRLASRLALSICVEVMILVVLLVGAGVHAGPWWSVAGALLFAELVGWTIRYPYIRPMLESLTHGVRTMAHAGERSEAALGQLKTTRERVRGERLAGGEIAEEGDTRGGAVEPPPIPLAGAGRRFDVGDEAAHAAAGDLSEALGGAMASGESGTQPPSARKGKDDAPAEDLTSRLLRAKKRAQREKKDE
ncbi:MAG: VWA domain-containing protein [Planctomycetes bacterium]|nr:VWA domain-containing protein [Planctomycetota bacterium]